MVGRLLGRVLGGNRTDHIQTVLEEGHACRLAGDLAGAVKRYDEALSTLSPQAEDAPGPTAAAYLARGITCRAARRDEQMLADYTAALRWLDQQDHFTGHDVYAMRANGRIRTGNLRTGEADYQRFCDLFEPGIPALLPDSAFDHDRATADCCRALAWQPELYTAVLCRGWLRMLQGDPAGATLDYERGLHLMPEDAATLLREKFRWLYENARNRASSGRLNKRAWMAPGWEYCLVRSGDDPGTTTIDFRGPDDEQTAFDDRPVYILREIISGEGWRYMASEYGEGDGETHYYRRKL